MNRLIAMWIFAVWTSVFNSTGMTAAKTQEWSFAHEVRSIEQGQRSGAILDANYMAVEERAKVKSLNFLPTLSASGTRGLSRDYIDSTNNNRSAAIEADVAINIFRFGGDAALRRQAESTVASASIHRSADRLAAETKAATPLIAALASQMEIDVFQRRMTATNEAITAAQARYNKGILSEQELAKLNLESANLNLTLKSTQRKANQSASLVNSLGGHLPPKSQQLLWPLGLAMHRSNPKKVMAVREWIRTIQPGSLAVKALEADVTSANASIAAARGAMLPSVDLTAMWKKNYVDGNGLMSDNSQVAATLTVPLFSKFSDISEYRARIQDAAAAQANLEAARATVNDDFKATVDGLVELLEEAELRDSQIAIADRLYRDNLTRFERGLVSVNDLSIDEHRVREAELTAINTWSKVHTELFHVAELAGQSVMFLL